MAAEPRRPDRIGSLDEAAIGRRQLGMTVGGVLQGRGVARALAAGTSSGGREAHSSLLRQGQSRLQPLTLKW